MRVDWKKAYLTVSDKYVAEAGELDREIARLRAENEKLARELADRAK